MSKSLTEQPNDPYTGGRWVGYWVAHAEAALQFLKQNRQALNAEPLKDSTAKLGDLVVTFTQQLHPIVDRVRLYLDSSQALPAKRPIELPINTGAKSSIPGGIPRSPVSSQLPTVPSWGGNKQVTVGDMALLGNVLSELAKVEGIKPEDAQELEESVVALLVDLKPYLEAVKAPAELLELCEELEEYESELTEEKRKDMLVKKRAFPLFSKMSKEAQAADTDQSGREYIKQKQAKKKGKKESVEEVFSPAGQGGYGQQAPSQPQAAPQTTNQLDPQKLLQILQRGMDAYRKAERTIDLAWLEQKPDTQQHLTNALMAMSEAYMMVRNVAGIVKGNPQQTPQESVQTEQVTTGPTEKFICSKCGITIPKTGGQAPPLCPKCHAPMGVVREDSEILAALARITS